MRTPGHRECYPPPPLNILGMEDGGNANVLIIIIRCRERIRIYLWGINIFGHLNIYIVYLDIISKIRYLDNIKFSCQKTLKSIQNYSETILF